LSVLDLGWEFDFSSRSISPGRVIFDFLKGFGKFMHKITGHSNGLVELLANDFFKNGVV
jgi:hypothetical protein